jgi:hypothetical protein
MDFFEWMATPAGRATRVVAGLVLVVLGLVGGGGWLVVSVLGLVPLVAGAVDVCVIAPLVGRPLRPRH